MMTIESGMHLFIYKLRGFRPWIFSQQTLGQNYNNPLRPFVHFPPFYCCERIFVFSHHDKLLYESSTVGIHTAYSKYKHNFYIKTLDKCIINKNIY